VHVRDALRVRKMNAREGQNLVKAPSSDVGPTQAQWSTLRTGQPKRLKMLP
jgi:hypothetical protein